MKADSLVNELKSRGVILQLNGDKLRYKPIKAIDPHLLDTMQRFKPDLVKYLQERRVCELLHRFSLGEITGNARQHLEEIFRDSPPDAWPRLLVACDYLGITGDDLERVAEEATNREREVN
jgi:hypothetical protein